MLVKIISLFDQNNTFPFMFKVEGLWVMVFWQRTQRHNALMIFPYGLKKKKNTFMSIANDGYKNKQSCIDFLAVYFPENFFFQKGIFLRKSYSVLQAKFSEVLFWFSSRNFHDEAELVWDIKTIKWNWSLPLIFSFNVFKMRLILNA